MVEAGTSGVGKHAAPLGSAAPSSPSSAQSESESTATAGLACGAWSGWDGSGNQVGDAGIVRCWQARHSSGVSRTSSPSSAAEPESGSKATEWLAGVAWSGGVVAQVGACRNAMVLQEAGERLGVLGEATW